MAGRMSRDEFKKQKEIEEARKKGELPPEQDEDGNLINPHIPEFMSKAPWYLNQEGPGLKHQKRFQDKHTTEYDGLDKEVVKRSRFVGRATKYRKGACRNCGAMHATKDCVERPRKVGAWKTGKDIAPDEAAPRKGASKLSYDGKRDRWYGYDPEEHARTIQRFNEADMERRRAKQAQRDSKFAETEVKDETDVGDGKASGAVAVKDISGSTTASSASTKKKVSGGTGGGDGSDSDSASSDDDDDLKESESIAVAGQETKSYTTKFKMTVRNLRLREDRAKYLINLDVDSAYYDPKTHSMRADPLPHIPKEERTYHGDNPTYSSGDAVDLAKAQLFAWDAYNTGTDVILEANPTQAALMQESFKKKKAALESTKKKSVMDKYGGEEHIQKLPSELLLGTGEVYREYGADGKVIKGEEKAVPRSRFEEDVFPNNHTAVWGSYYDRASGSWGFGCCHQLLKNSYCTGEAGKAAAAASAASLSAGPARSKLEAKDSKGTAKPVTSKAAALYGEDLAPELDPEKLAKAKRRAQHRAPDPRDDRKRKYNSMSADTFEISPEDMEVHKMNKVRADDPMAAFLAKKPRS